MFARLRATVTEAAAEALANGLAGPSSDAGDGVDEAGSGGGSFRGAFGDDPAHFIQERDGGPTLVLEGEDLWSSAAKMASLIELIKTVPEPGSAWDGKSLRYVRICPFLLHHFNIESWGLRIGRRSHPNHARVCDTRIQKYPLTLCRWIPNVTARPLYVRTILCIFSKSSKHTACKTIPWEENAALTLLLPSLQAPRCGTSSECIPTPASFTRTAGYSMLICTRAAGV